MKRRTFLRNSGLAASLSFLPTAYGATTSCAMTPEVDPDKLLADIISAATDQGAKYADARFVSFRFQSLQVRQDKVYSANDSDHCGIVLRAWKNGGWGFAANSNVNRLRVSDFAREATHNAMLAARYRRQELIETNVINKPGAEWFTPDAVNPFNVDLSDKTDFLLSLTTPLQSLQQVAYSVANLFQMRKETRYVNSYNGTFHQIQHIIHPNFAVTAFDKKTRRMDSRNSFSEARGGGWERATTDAYKSEIRTSVLEVSEKQRATPVTSGRYDLVIDSSALWHILYETLAHYLDPRSMLGLDGRRPGDHIISPDDLGTKKIGSDLLNLDYDNVLEAGLNTSGWDDAGRKTLRASAVNKGILMGLPGSDELPSPVRPWSVFSTHAGEWNALPQVSMPNLFMHGEDHVGIEQLISKVQSGLLIKGRGPVVTNASRTVFRYRPQLAWKIENGVRKEMVRDFEIETSVEQFWNMLAALGGDRERILGGDLFPRSRNALWGVPFSVSVPPAMFTDIPVYRIAEAT